MVGLCPRLRWRRSLRQGGWGGHYFKSMTDKLPWPLPLPVGSLLNTQDAKDLLTLSPQQTSFKRLSFMEPGL